MHGVTEYKRLIRDVVWQADEMTARLSPESLPEGVEVLNFLRRFGCEGFPCDCVDRFDIGPWISRSGHPQHQHEGFAVVPCFSDDVPPIAPYEDDAGGVSGRCLYTDHAVVLYNVDRGSLVEVALVLLHEARHARHRIGPKVMQLAPLDPTLEVHETNTWIFTLNLLRGWGGEAWQQAVQCEVSWIMRHPELTATESATEIRYVASHEYWPELDVVFGKAPHESAHRVRRSLVALHANILYWSHKNPLFIPQLVCHSIIAHHSGL